MRLKKVVAAKDKRKKCDIQRSCDTTFTDISQSLKPKSITVTLMAGSLFSNIVNYGAT